ncbi:pepsin/retropepsin-like aspartic protease family protein [Longitalea arenae]|uniref:pepsin/retropepsin-like aspartic protease family protein n=1 Tax=Longitalea arenae TaxID=2812558 RepID=UPI001966E97D|nr:pepsin/retropepsin-like aspartic protease family protein [Longitalea arenae]
MRITLFLICFLSGISLFAADIKRLDSLLSRRHFFELQRALESDINRDLPAYRKLYYQAFLYNFFHNLTRSNEVINLLLEKHKKQLTPGRIGSLLMKKIDNHVKLYQYREAHLTTQLVLRKYRQVLSAEERDDARNSDIIWKGLQNVAPQTTTITGETQIAYRRDLAGLINVPVNFADSTFDFVFDTGANLSVITESYARKTKLRLLNVRFKVRAITGLQVQANLGIADELRMGNIIVRNAVFMIFPDSALSFARGAYTIKGIIGFPVIEQLQEIRINKNKVIVPAVAVDRRIRNFGVDELLPVISVAYKTDTLAFTFDTGAQFTFLNEPFYRDYKRLIDTAGTSFDMQIGGAGGITKTKAFRLPQVHINVAGQPAVLKDVAVKTASSTPKDNLYYGNLGQDVMNQFAEMVINFRYMYVDFIPATP